MTDAGSNVPPPDDALKRDETSRDYWDEGVAFFRRLGPAGYLAIIATCVPGISGFVLIGLSRGYVAPWLRAHPDSGLPIYIGGLALLCGFAMLPTYAQSLLGGMAFGFRIGVAAALCGFAGASIIGYVVARRASGDRVIKIINEHAKWRAVYDALVGRGFWRTLGIVTLVRLPPNSPFALTNLVMAATRVPPAAYFLGTMIGIAPRTAAVVYLGSQLKEEKSWWVYGINIAVTVVVIAVIGHIANKALTSVTGPRGPGKATQR